MLVSAARRPLRLRSLLAAITRRVSTVIITTTIAERARVLLRSVRRTCLETS